MGVTGGDGGWSTVVEPLGVRPGWRWGVRGGGGDGGDGWGWRWVEVGVRSGGGGGGCGEGGGREVRGEGWRIEGWRWGEGWR